MAAASQPSTAVNFAVPSGACDTHVHVFGNTRDFPFAVSRAYTPETASVEELRRLHRALHIERVVVVQPSVYGTDNSCTLDAIRQLGPGARGVGVIDENATDSVLDQMQRGGIRGLRINLGVTQSDAAMARSRFQSVAKRAKAPNWHIQMFLPLELIEPIADLVRNSPVPVIFDHFAGAQAAGGVRQPGFSTVLDLVRSGKAYVKVSAAYRVSTQDPDYADVMPLARALVEANPQRILWGTDWPHPNSAPPPGGKPTDVTPLYTIDDGRLLNEFAAWVPDAAQRKTILVENPARLYGF